MEQPSSRGDTRALLRAEKQNHLTWKPDRLVLNLEAMNAEQGLHTLQEVDLVNIIGVGQQREKGDPSKQFFLPRDVFNVNTQEFRQKEISRYIATPCYKAGFEIVMKGWEKGPQCLRFMCSTGRCYHSKQSKTTNLIMAARKKDHTLLELIL
jgi:hypothetical protein